MPRTKKSSFETRFACDSDSSESSEEESSCSDDDVDLKKADEKQEKRLRAMAKSGFFNMEAEEKNIESHEEEGEIISSIFCCISFVKQFSLGGDIIENETKRRELSISSDDEEEASDNDEKKKFVEDEAAVANIPSYSSGPPRGPQRPHNKTNPALQQLLAGSTASKLGRDPAPVVLASAVAAAKTPPPPPPQPTASVSAVFNATARKSPEEWENQLTRKRARKLDEHESHSKKAKSDDVPKQHEKWTEEQQLVLMAIHVGQGHRQSKTTRWKVTAKQFETAMPDFLKPHTGKQCYNEFKRLYAIHSQNSAKLLKRHLMPAVAAIDFVQKNPNIFNQEEQNLSWLKFIQSEGLNFKFDILSKLKQQKNGKPADIEEATSTHAADIKERTAKLIGLPEKKKAVASILKKAAEKRTPTAPPLPPLMSKAFKEYLDGQERLQFKVRSFSCFLLIEFVFQTFLFLQESSHLYRFQFHFFRAMENLHHTIMEIESRLPPRSHKY